jgi:hypothetical protein
LAESARLRHASLDLRKLEDPRRRPAPARTDRAGQELGQLLAAAEREAAQLEEARVVLPCSLATIRQTEGALGAAEAAGTLPPSPSGEHPELLVLRFVSPEATTDARGDVQRAVFAETEAYTLHATVHAAFRGDPGLRIERVFGYGADLLLVVRPTPGPDTEDLQRQVADGEPVFLSARAPRAQALRRVVALKRLLLRWEAGHLPLLNLFNPEARSWGDAQALNVGDEADEWRLLAPTETAAREFVRKAIGSPDFALLAAPDGPARRRATAELVLQGLRRRQRFLVAAADPAELTALLAAVHAQSDAALLAAPLRLLAEGESAEPRDPTPTFAGRVADLQRAGATPLKRDEAERVALDSTNLVVGTFAGLARHPMLRPAQLARDAADFDQLLVLGADRLAFRDFLPFAVHAAKWTLVGAPDGAPSEPTRTELAALAADEAERAGRFAELQAELAYKACVGKDGSADDEDAELADAHGRRKVLLILETPGDEARALAVAAQHLRQRQLNVATCLAANASSDAWAAPAAEVNVIATTRACVERTDLLARLSTDFRLVVTEAPTEALAPLAARMKAPKTRGKAAKPRPVIALSWSLRTADNLRGIHAHRADDGARGEHARALLLDLRSIFPFEKPLWEPRALLELKERVLASAFETLDTGVRADTGANRSELVYHSGLPRPGSLASRKEALR